jgi:hypothetical protein
VGAAGNEHHLGHPSPDKRLDGKADHGPIVER